MELENENNHDDQYTETVLGQFTFQKSDTNQRTLRSTANRMAKTKAYEKSFVEKDEIEDDSSFAYDRKREKSQRSTPRITPSSTMEDEDMFPPKSSKKGKKNNSVSESKRLKDQLKETKLDETSLYLFNYMKEVKTNKINKSSLKKTFKGLLIDNITEEQADMMLNYPNLDPKDLIKEELNYEDFKQIVKACNFKFDTDGNLL